jgi:D-alanyl-D-alanine carboxypeptidase
MTIRPLFCRDRAHIALGLAVVSGLLLVGCGGDDDASSTTTEAAEEAEAFEDRVTAAAQDMLDSGAANGATAVHVAISDPDEGDVTVVLGTLAEDGDQEASEDDSFPIGSITKTFTATVILQMIEDGDVSLDDTVGDLLADLATSSPEIAGITVEQLLTMTSGIPDYFNVPDSVVVDVVEDPTRVWQPEELIAAGVAGGLEAFGTAGYSTTNYLILQLIAESVGDAPLEELIASMVTEPLGLDASVLPDPEDTTLPDPHTHGYVAGACVAELAADGATVEEGTDTTDWNTSSSQGGGGMYSTIGDLLGWAQSTAGNTLLGGELAAQRLRTAPLPEGISYGLGIMQVDDWYGHEGEAIGWEALSVTDPDSGVSVAIAMNGCGGQFKYFLELLAALYPDATGAGSASTGDATDAAAASGEPVDGEQQVSFVDPDGAVTAKWTSCAWDGENLELSAEGQGARIEATTGDDGSIAVSVTGSKSYSGSMEGDETEGVLALSEEGSAGTAALIVNTVGCG